MSSRERKRLSTAVDEETLEKVQYWAKKREVSQNVYLREALEEKLKRENGDYDLPTLEIQRLNQLIDAMTSMSQNLESLERVVVSGFESLLGLTRGDNYLLDTDDEGF